MRDFWAVNSKKGCSYAGRSFPTPPALFMQWVIGFWRVMNSVDGVGKPSVRVAPVGRNVFRRFKGVAHQWVIRKGMHGALQCALHLSKPPMVRVSMMIKQ